MLHELGVVHYISGEYTPAIHCFGKVAKRGRDTLDDEAREPSIFNLGHAYRKLRLYEQAAEAYEAALAIRPRSASTFAALGFTRHLQGRIDAAIELYHQALSLKSDDTFTSEMLTEALRGAIGGRTQRWHGEEPLASM